MEVDTHKKFGTFLGVFTPSILTILGVIMYLRFGWVIASVGLGGTLLIVLICSAVALITALSAAAVATNIPLGTGGEYYLVSRSLGLPIGGAIGIPLYLCRTLSVTLYCFGLAEALAMVWPASWGQPPLPYLAAGFILLTTIIAGKSAEASLKLQIPLMGLVVLSILALAVGTFMGPLRRPDLLAPATTIAYAGGFWAVLAVYFPAITGFNAGLGMSGDLRDPQKSIPRGILLAVMVGTLVYLTVPILLGVSGKATVEQLADISPQSGSVWTRIAVLGGILVFPGMWAAILSSAFGSALAGARVLQALARDGLSPKFLARTSKTGQPTWATWASGAIAVLAVALGNLNAVATVVTIFFLTLYMSINLVAATESVVRDPSYRPTIRVPWAISLLGALGNLALMFLISPLGCVIAIALELVVWLYLRRRTLKATWGSVWAGIWGTLARLAIHKLGDQPQDPRSWRPNILLFVDRIEQHVPLVRVVSWLNQNRGILTVCNVLNGQAESDMPVVQSRQTSMENALRQQAVAAFAEVDLVGQFEDGVANIAQASGIGSLRPNAIVLGWPSHQERLASLLRIVRTLHHLGKPALIVRPASEGAPIRYRRIDVWWRGRENCGDLMLLLAHLVKLNPLWRLAQTRLRTVVASEEERLGMETVLADLIASVRIKAVLDVIVPPAGQSVPDAIRATSRDADLVFMGLMIPEVGQESEYAQRLIGMVDGLPTTVLVRNSGPLSGRLI